MAHEPVEGVTGGCQAHRASSQYATGSGELPSDIQEYLDQYVENPTLRQELAKLAQDPEGDGLDILKALAAQKVRFYVDDRILQFGAAGAYIPEDNSITIAPSAQRFHTGDRQINEIEILTVLTHEALHAISPDGDSQFEEGINDIIGYTIALRVLDVVPDGSTINPAFLYAAYLNEVNASVHADVPDDNSLSSTFQDELYLAGIRVSDYVPREVMDEIGADRFTDFNTA